LIIEIYSQ